MVEPDIAQSRYYKAGTVFILRALGLYLEDFNLKPKSYMIDRYLDLRAWGEGSENLGAA